MISANQAISIEQVTQLEGYKLQLVFNDHSKKTVDFQPFLTQSLNPLIRKYLAPEEFAKFEIDGGDLEWNGYDLCFSMADLYENRIWVR